MKKTICIMLTLFLCMSALAQEVIINDPTGDDDAICLAVNRDGTHFLMYNRNISELYVVDNLSGAALPVKFASGSLTEEMQQEVFEYLLRGKKPEQREAYKKILRLKGIDYDDAYTVNPVTLLNIPSVSTVHGDLALVREGGIIDLRTGLFYFLSSTCLGESGLATALSFGSNKVLVQNSRTLAQTDVSIEAATQNGEWIASAAYPLSDGSILCTMYESRIAPNKHLAQNVVFVSSDGSVQSEISVPMAALYGRQNDTILYSEALNMGLIYSKNSLLTNGCIMQFARNADSAKILYLPAREDKQTAEQAVAVDFELFTNADGVAELQDFDVFVPLGFMPDGVSLFAINFVNGDILCIDMKTLNVTVLFNSQDFGIGSVDFANAAWNGNDLFARLRLAEGGTAVVQVPIPSEYLSNSSEFEL